MDKSEQIERIIKNLEHLRDIILKNGIRNDAQDQQLQSLCDKIDSMYEELIKLLGK